MWEDSYACVPSTHLVIDSNENHQSLADDQLCHRRFAWGTADLLQFPCPCPGIRALSWLERANPDAVSPGGQPSCSTLCGVGKELGRRLGCHSPWDVRSKSTWLLLGPQSRRRAWSRSRQGRLQRCPSSDLGTPEKGIRRLDPKTAHERRVVGPDSWLYSGQ